MLGDSQAINDGGAIGFCIHFCRLNKVVGIDAANLRDLFGSIVSDHFRKFAKALRTVLNELTIGKPPSNNCVYHTVRKRDIGTRPQLQMHIGFARKGNVARINHNEFCPTLDRLANAHAHDGMRLFGVAAHEQNDLRLLAHVFN